jgi:transcriptional regulator with XRE-family HTH domain
MVGNNPSFTLCMYKYNMGGQKTRDKKIMAAFGRQLRELRKQQKLTQKSLAERAGISVSQVARMETGELNTTISTIVKLSKALELASGVLLEGLENAI